jgi:hypothetical protein
LYVREKFISANVETTSFNSSSSGSPLSNYFADRPISQKLHTQPGKLQNKLNSGLRKSSLATVLVGSQANPASQAFAPL